MEELAPLLRELAIQLGTTVEFLWEVMVRQGRIEFVIFVIGILVIFVLYVALRYIILHTLAKMADDEEDEENRNIASIVISVIGTFILLMYVFINGQSAITALLNPEYWALQRILEAIR